MSIIGKFTLEDFVRESNRIEGIHRDPTQEEISAHRQFLGRDLSLDSIVAFVACIAPHAELRNKPGLDVRVGNHVPPRGGMEIEGRLRTLVADILCHTHTPWHAHIIYETLHPFTDGNGRSGRAVWLHMHNGYAPLGFLHWFYYETLRHSQERGRA